MEHPAHSDPWLSATKPSCAISPLCSWGHASSMSGRHDCFDISKPSNRGITPRPPSSAPDAWPVMDHIRWAVAPLTWGNRTVSGTRQTVCALSSPLPAHAGDVLWQQSLLDPIASLHVAISIRVTTQRPARWLCELVVEGVEIRLISRQADVELGVTKVSVLSMALCGVP